MPTSISFKHMDAIPENRTGWECIAWILKKTAELSFWSIARPAGNKAKGFVILAVTLP